MSNRFLNKCNYLEGAMGYIEYLRKVVGNHPLILAGVAVAVINESGEFLFQKRSDGLWGVLAGSLN